MVTHVHQHHGDASAHPDVDVPCHEYHCHLVHWASAMMHWLVVLTWSCSSSVVVTVIDQHHQEGNYGMPIMLDMDQSCP